MKKKMSLSKKIDLYREEIYRRNYINLQKFTMGGMILTGIISLVAILAYPNLYFTEQYCISFCIFLMGFLFTHFVLRQRKEYTILTFYIILTPLYIVGILMGSFLDPENAAITVMILLCTLTVFITDKPKRVFIYMACVEILFTICSFISKSGELFLGDMVNMAVYTSIGAGVNLLTLTDRVNSVENYVLMCDRADKDALTSLLNRGAGENAMIKMLQKGYSGSFIILDIDNFKYFNDSYGHGVGDEVICAVAQQLQKVFPYPNVLFRFGGDEFAVFAVGILNRDICEACMNSLRERLLGVTTSYPEPLDIKISMGCTIFQASACNFDRLYHSSDDALYTAKENGKNGFVIREMTEE